MGYSLGDGSAVLKMQCSGVVRGMNGFEDSMTVALRAFEEIAADP